MALKLRYLDRSQLWADLLSNGGERVFVETDEQLKVGDAVALLVEAPELTSPLAIAGTVQGLRPTAGPLAAGLFLKIDAASLEACRAAVGTPRAEIRVAGRREVRVDCNLDAQLTSPQLIERCLAKSLSLTGFTLKGPVKFTDGMAIKLLLSLPEGAPVALGAQVVWARPELQLAGLKITSVTNEVAIRLDAAIAQLASVKQGPAATGLTVVVADDDPSIREFIGRTVSKLGHQVFRAERGDTGLALIREKRPKLVFLDVLMPGLDGLEVCKALRADAVLAKIPVVLLSAMGEQRLIDATRGAGASAYLIKPMRLEALRALITRYLG